MLFAEQRGQNDSGGEMMGFGLVERFDCFSWASYLAEKTDGELPIYLAGVSMGAGHRAYDGRDLTSRKRCTE